MAETLGPPSTSPVGAVSATAAATAPAAGRPSTTATDDWPNQAADTIVRVVGSVRDRTTGPAVSAARALVYGTLAAILGTTALVLLSILVVRGLVLALDGLLEALDIDEPGRATWIAHLLVGLVFTLGGLALWRKGRTATAD